MAAPAEAYRTKSLYARNLANSADIQHLTAILQTDKPTMLSRFAIDGIFNVNLPDGTDGVIGYCKIGSPNYNLHNTARQGNLRVYDGGDCVLFHDAGLNTLPWCDVPVMVSAQNGNIQVKQPTFKAAYYLNTTEYKLVLSPDSSFATGTDYISGVMNQGEVLSNLMITSNSNHGIGTTIYFKASITNAEGTYQSGVYSFVTVPLLIPMKFGTDPTSAQTGTLRNYLTNLNRLEVDGYLYEDKGNGTLIQTANAGFYDDGTLCFKVDETGLIIAQGVSGDSAIGQTGGGTPTYAVIDCSYGSTATASCNNWKTSKGILSYSLDTATNTLTKVSGGTVASDGWYTYDNGGAMTRQVISGIMQQAYTNCI